MSLQLVSQNMDFDENQGWFCDNIYNSLCTINIKTNDILCVKPIPIDTGVDTYSGIKVYEDKVILVPSKTNILYVYDTTTGSFTDVKIDIECMKGSKLYRLFSGIHVWNNQIILTPARYPYLVFIDMDTYKVKYEKEWYIDFEKKMGSRDNQYMLSLHKGEIQNNVLLLPLISRTHKAVLEYNLKKRSHRIVTIEDSVGGIVDLIYAENKIYMCTHPDKEILECDLNGRILKTHIISDRNCSGILKLIDSHLDDHILIVDEDGGTIVQYNLKKNTFSELFRVEEIKSNIKKYIFDNKKLVVLGTDSKNENWIYNKYSGEVVKYGMNGISFVPLVCYEIESVKNILSGPLKGFKYNKAVRESQFGGIEELISYLG